MDLQLTLSHPFPFNSLIDDIDTPNLLRLNKTLERYIYIQSILLGAKAPQNELADTTPRLQKQFGFSFKAP